MLFKIEDAFVNPEHVAAVLPHNGLTGPGGIELAPPNPNRCVILLGSGKTIETEGSAPKIAAWLSGGHVRVNTDEPAGV